MLSGPAYNGLVHNITQFCGTKGLRMLNLNIRGLQGNFDEFKNILANSNIDIFALNEIFVSTDDETLAAHNKTKLFFLLTSQIQNSSKSGGTTFPTNLVIRAAEEGL